MSPATDARIDAEQLNLMLTTLRLPTIRSLWKPFAERADAEGWPAARLLAALAEHELAERERRRKERHLNEARLPPGKSLESFEFAAVPTLSKARVHALAAGDGWLEQGANCLMFGPSGTGKSHLAAAIGFALVENGYRVLFARTTDLAQKLQRARQELALEAALARLDRYQLLILDDFTYLQKDEAESGVLFELISLRYERRSLLLTANQPFQEWGRLFPLRDRRRRSRRSPRASLRHPRDECRKLPTASRTTKRQKARAAGKICDTEEHRQRPTGIAPRRDTPSARSPANAGSRRSVSFRIQRPIAESGVTGTVIPE